ncbi:hypothetical protein V8G54_012181 [Vigna mungo]|uniref:Uncharacterized protein n=1 Tax=Vigna mungo TaxID=3915 RepID=A0AAQ3NRS1_VIGMU
MKITNNSYIEYLYFLSLSHVAALQHPCCFCPKNNSMDYNIFLLHMLLHVFLSQKEFPLSHPFYEFGPICSTNSTLSEFNNHFSISSLPAIYPLCNVPATYRDC